MLRIQFLKAVKVLFLFWKASADNFREGPNLKATFGQNLKKTELFWSRDRLRGSAFPSSLGKTADPRKWSCDQKYSVLLRIFGHMITWEGPHFQAVCLRLRTLTSDHVTYKTSASSQTRSLCFYLLNISFWWNESRQSQVFEFEIVKESFLNSFLLRLILRHFKFSSFMWQQLSRKEGEAKGGLKWKKHQNEEMKWTNS